MLETPAVHVAILGGGFGKCCGTVGGRVTAQGIRPPRGGLKTPPPFFAPKVDHAARAARVKTCQILIVPLHHLIDHQEPLTSTVGRFESGGAGPEIWSYAVVTVLVLVVCLPECEKVRFETLRDP